MKRSNLGAIAAAGAMFLACAVPGSALGHHLTKIREVKPAGPGSTAYVELQAYAPGQNLVEGKLRLTVYDPSGNSTGSMVLDHDVAEDGDQRTILVRADATGSPDFVMPALALDGTGGQMCLTDELPAFELDCVAWGSVTAPRPGTGALAPEIPVGSSLERSIERGCATKLDSADDLDDSASDFALNPAPVARNNAAVPIEASCVPVTGGGGGSGGGTAAAPEPKKKARAKCAKAKRVKGKRAQVKRKCGGKRRR